jgi:hypothetical protein
MRHLHRTRPLPRASRPAAAPRLALAALVLVGAGSGAHAAAQEPPQPYQDPPFTCEVHDYGTDAPTLPGPDDDPLCVRYDKTHLMVSTLEVVDFLVAEPGRVALAAGRCGYWQQDHWVVRAAPGGPALVSWEGSYWYDVRSGTGAAVLRDLRVADAPVDGAAFVEAMRPLVGDEQADALLAYTDDGGGGGMSFAVPADGAAMCPAATGPSDGTGAPDLPASTATATAAQQGSSHLADVRATGASRASLPATGGGPPAAAAAVALGAAALVRRLSRA